MTWDLIHAETREGFDIRYYAAPEQDDPAGHFDDNGQTAQAIDAGRYEWFVAKVTASKAGVELADDYLGGCCYETAWDFVRAGDYYEDMVDIVIGRAREKLLALGVAPTEIMSDDAPVSDEERSYGPHHRPEDRPTPGFAWAREVALDEQVALDGLEEYDFDYVEGAQAEEAALMRGAA